ncbi:MAG: formamidopyrimidine-DNA glycosylase [Frankiales bacterium]|nr:formamidopyrimidine-DNA glycosylase [Frankiales bacterium]
MPELPEVQALVAFLSERAVGHVVARVDVAAISALKTFDPAPSALIGLEITSVTRHGKFLDLDVDGLHLVVHLARAGWLQWKDSLPTAPPKPSSKSPIALRLHLDDGSGFDLTEAGTRKGLAVYIVRSPAQVPGISRLGIDATSPELGVDALAALLGQHRAQLKGVLTDQTVIAGIGNAYSDEILHFARLSPFKMAAKLTGDEVARLHAAINIVLADALQRSLGLRAAELKGEKRTGMAVHARTGEPCPDCGDTVREVSFADSSLQYCPTCQTGGKPLADRRLSKLLK